jgi:hypothetical protein
VSGLQAAFFNTIGSKLSFFGVRFRAQAQDVRQGTNLTPDFDRAVARHRQLARLKSPQL